MHQQYRYLISTTLTRLHANPPLWTDYHPHDFIFRVELKPIAPENEIHEIDMVRAEEALQKYVMQLPAKINDYPLCPNGTTEQLCEFLAGFSYPSAALLSVQVGETANRITIKDLSNDV